MSERTFSEMQVVKHVQSYILPQMVHDFRSPLSIILEYARMLTDAEEPDPARTQKHAEVIIRNASNLLQVVNDVFDLSRVERGQMAVHIAPLELTSTVNEIVEPYAQMASHKNLFCRTTFAFDGALHIRTDKVRLSQILVNLLTNAIKFTDDGEVGVHVSAEPIERSPSLIRLRIDVSDTGKGIESQFADKLFNFFEQGPQNERIEFGAGLGLALARSLSRALGGDLVLTRNDVGRGTTFSFQAVVSRHRDSV